LHLVGAQNITGERGRRSATIGRMGVFERIAEERIRQAQEEGLFDNNPGKGKPFEFEDDSSVPEDLRLTYKILKNSNCLPVEVDLRRDIFSLRQLLEKSVDTEDRLAIRRNLNRLLLKLEYHR
jgi:hypothetical protein